MKQFSLILLIGAFLWSTSGIGMLMHYCEGKLKHTSLYGMAERDGCHPETEMSCHAEQPKACCAIMAKLQEAEAQDEHKGCTSPDKNCCDDQFFFLKIADEFLSITSTDVDREIDQLIASFVLLKTWVEVDFHQDNHPPFRKHPPPPKLVPLPVLHQQFRL